MVKDGYKHTEIGVIPENWEYAQFQDVLDGFTSGMTPYRGNPEYYKGNIRWITSGELNYNIIEDTHEKITLEAVKKTNLKILPKGTFLMAITGLEAEGTRGSCGLVGAVATTNQSCMALFSTEKMIVEYLYHFYVKYGNLLAFKYCQGTKQQSYTAKIVKILPIVYPPNIKEQKAIAKALSDTDRLITSLEALIEKKENIKTATMQQLLTGKKRLDGFSEEWVERKLGEVATVVSGGTPSTIINNFWNGNISWFTPTETGKIKYVSESNRKISKLGLNNSSAKLLPIGTILLTTRAVIGNVAILQQEATTNQGFQSLIIKNKYNNEFIYYLLITLKRDLLSNASGSTFLEISPNKIKNIKISIPSKKEQHAIAQILSDMDKEIESLKERLDKIKAIKMGMMQELLTGRVRLLGAKNDNI